jgi:hypothetical protein
MLLTMSRRGHQPVRFVLAVTCLALLVAPTLGAQQPPAAGVVKNVTGTATIVRAGRERPAAPGQPIAEGDTDRTAAGGRLGITLKDGTRLSLGGNTEVRLDTFAYSPAQGRLGLVLKLLRGVTGYISGRIARLAPGAVKIETPTSVIGVRGTSLLIRVEQP